MNEEIRENFRKQLVSLIQEVLDISATCDDDFDWCHWAEYFITQCSMPESRSVMLNNTRQEMFCLRRVIDVCRAYNFQSGNLYKVYTRHHLCLAAHIWLCLGNIDPRPILPQNLEDNLRIYLEAARENLNKFYNRVKEQIPSEEWSILLGMLPAEAAGRYAEKLRQEKTISFNELSA